MSKELIYILITKMHVKLNEIIEENDFDLLSYKVQHYSRRLDRVIIHYNRIVDSAAAGRDLLAYLRRE